jgi:hypothetical protein
MGSGGLPLERNPHHAARESRGVESRAVEKDPHPCPPPEYRRREKRKVFIRANRVVFNFPGD